MPICDTHDELSDVVTPGVGLATGIADGEGVDSTTEPTSSEVDTERGVGPGVVGIGARVDTGAMVGTGVGETGAGVGAGAALGDGVPGTGAGVGAGAAVGMSEGEVVGASVQASTEISKML